MRATVRVPATTANIGPGFDCLGMALPIYNTITIEEMVLPGSGIQINIFDENETNDPLFLPTDENSIVYKAIELLYNSVGQNPSELKININTQIPIAKGLGSSASVIVGALIASNKILGNPADESALLSIATEVEGHPDNIAPAILGGFVLSSLEEDGSVVYRKIDWPEEWNITLCIPNYEVSTDISRSVLPKEISVKDATFNLKRSAMLIQAINTKDSELMKLALQDKIHQPYRQKIVPGFKEITDTLKNEENVLGVVLSGAGPTIVVFSQGNGNKLERVKEKVHQAWHNLNIKSEIKTVKIEKQGAIFIEE